jgi:hypothetical protein
MLPVEVFTLAMLRASLLGDSCGRAGNEEPSIYRSAGISSLKRSQSRKPCIPCFSNHGSYVPGARCSRCPLSSRSPEADLAASGTANVDDMVNVVDGSPVTGRRRAVGGCSRPDDAGWSLTCAALPSIAKLCVAIVLIIAADDGLVDKEADISSFS